MMNDHLRVFIAIDWGNIVSLLGGLALDLCY